MESTTQGHQKTLKKLPVDQREQTDVESTMAGHQKLEKKKFPVDQREQTDVESTMSGHQKLHKMPKDQRE